MRFALLVTILMICLGGLRGGLPAWAHHGHHHEDEKPLAPDQLAAINTAYVRDVKPIFQNKCGDCHSSNTVYPFFYHWPVARRLIDGDIAEAQGHFQIDDDFPFKGHGSVQDNFTAIREDVTAGSMPPWRYWIIHWDKRLTAQEKQIILKWTSESEDLLRKPSP